MNGAGPSPPSQDDAAPAAEIARRLHLDLPDACIPGVAANTRLLAQHWENLRGFDPPAKAP